MRKLYLTIFITGILVMFTSQNVFAEKPLKQINIGTHPMGSFYSVLGTAVADVIIKHTPYRATVKAMAGPAAWFPLLLSEDVDIGWANCWDSEKGYFGQSLYKKLSGGKGFPIRLLAVSIPNYAGLVVAGDSDIYSYSQLKGKRVGGPLPGPGQQLQTEAYLANGGVSWSEIRPVPVSTVSGGVRAVIEGRADCSAVAVLGMPVISELNAKRGARFLPLDPSPEAVKRVRDKYPGYPIEISPAPGRAGIQKKQYMWAFDNYLVARANLPDDVAYQIVKALWENRKELATYHARLKGWTHDKFVSKEALVPYHPGAIRFYKEQGVWTPEMENLQRELLSEKK